MEQSFHGESFQYDSRAPSHVISIGFTPIEGMLFQMCFCAGSQFKIYIRNLVRLAVELHGKEFCLSTCLAYLRINHHHFFFFLVLMQ